MIGDGTFLHGGIPGLIDMVYQNSHATLVICDNSTTGMTGQQENASSGKALHGETAPEVDIVELVKALGVRHVEVVDPYDLDKLRKTLRAAPLSHDQGTTPGRSQADPVRSERL